MRKKQLKEKLAALNLKRTAEHRRLTDIAAGTIEAHDTDFAAAKDALYAMDDEAAKIQTEIESIEEFEQGARERAAAAANTGERQDPARPAFAGFGEFLQAVAFAGIPGRTVDPRLTTFAAGASEGVPSDGGYLVQPEYAALLYNRAFESAGIASRCRRVGLGANSNRLVIPVINETSRATGSRWGGVRVYRANEAATVTAAKPTLDKLEITVEKLMGIAYATEELLADAGVVEQIFSSAFSEEFAFTLDDEIINGDGAGKCLGILNAPATITVNKVSGQAAATFVYENVPAMWTRMPIRNRRSAVWLINQDVEPQLFTMTQAISTAGGTPVYLPPGGASAEPYGTLYGRPVIPAEQMPTIGTKGDVMLTDLSQYLLVEKGGIQPATSMHVRFIYDEMAFRWTLRVNGQPSWKTAITPFKGTNTLSPFVTLQTRS